MVSSWVNTLTGFDCPFCILQGERVIHAAPFAFAIWDQYPVSPGHALVISRRHFADWFEASREEQAELLAALEAVRKAITDQYSPDGFNIGVNIGGAAGQTVPHLHIHVIPRYVGDIEDPTGGVRAVIPEKANYLKNCEEPVDVFQLPHNRVLVCGGDDPLLSHLRAHIDRADAVDVAVAFTLENGLTQVLEHFRDLLTPGRTPPFLNRRLS
jgi:diadenosine tetraphosphate (Ap4A) HIT family hydrolase